MAGHDYQYPTGAPPYQEDFPGFDQLRQHNTSALPYAPTSIQEQPLYGQTYGTQVDMYGQGGFALDDRDSPYLDLLDTNYRGAYQTPPRAMSSTPMDDIPTHSTRMTRSGRTFDTRESASQGLPALGPHPSRVQKATSKRAPRKRATSKQPSTRATSVTPAGRKKKALPDHLAPPAPLSELVGGVSPKEAQDTDVEAWVKRTSDERQSEVSRSKSGKIKRPPNAFMLYRMAYQKRASAIFKHDNHQVISKICGASWAMEDNDVRRQFIDWSSDEREAHAKAFPEYRFAPAKTKKKGPDRSERAGSEDDIDYLEELDFTGRSPAPRIYEPEAEYRPAGMSCTPYRDSLTPSPAAPLPFGSDSLPYSSPSNHQSGYQYRHYTKPYPHQPEYYDIHNDLRAPSATPQLAENTYLNHSFTSMPASSNNCALPVYPDLQDHNSDRFEQPHMNQAHLGPWASNGTSYTLGHDSGDFARSSRGPTEFGGIPSPSPQIDPSLLSLPDLERDHGRLKSEELYASNNHTTLVTSGLAPPLSPPSLYNTPSHHDGLPIMNSIETPDFGYDGLYGDVDPASWMKPDEADEGDFLRSIERSPSEANGADDNAIAKLEG